MQSQCEGDLRPLHSITHLCWIQFGATDSMRQDHHSMDSLRLCSARIFEGLMYGQKQSQDHQNSIHPLWCYRSLCAVGVVIQCFLTPNITTTFDASIAARMSMMNFTHGFTRSGVLAATTPLRQRSAVDCSGYGFTDHA